MKTIRITADKVVKEATLNDSETAEAIWQALPLEGVVNRWGDEIYFNVPVQVDRAQDAQTELEIGALAYWPPGKAFCLFWGPTPASLGREPRAASAVNVFGKVADTPTDFAPVRDGATIRIERIGQ
jgi:hypothetical protein